MLLYLVGGHISKRFFSMSAVSTNTREGLMLFLFITLAKSICSSQPAGSINESKLHRAGSSGQLSGGGMVRESQERVEGVPMSPYWKSRGSSYNTSMV